MQERFKGKEAEIQHKDEVIAEQLDGLIQQVNRNEELELLVSTDPRTIGLVKL